MSCAVAVPAVAGIPVTHRGIASSFAVVTGHEDPDKPGGRVDWEPLAGAVDTIVVLMGTAALPEIVRRLLAAGRDPVTPVAVISRGTTAAEAVVTGSLVDIDLRAAHLPAPCTIVIGDVVRLRGDAAEHGGCRAQRRSSSSRRAQTRRSRVDYPA